MVQDAGTTSPEVVGRSPSPRPDRREQVLSAAQDLIAEGGFAAASVRAVAARAGIGASTMRYWFPTQEALSTAVAQRMLSVQLRDERIAETSLPPVERLVECLTQFLPSTTETPAAQAAQVQAWFALIASAVGPTANPVGRALYAGMLRTSRDRIETWLRRLADEGALAPADVPLAALALLTRLDGLVLGLALPGTTLDLSAATAVLRSDVEHLLLGEQR